MAVRSFRMGSLLAVLALLPSSGFAKEPEVCTIGRIAELAVTMNGMRPMVDAKIDGKDAKFIADSGAFFSLLSPAAAAEYNLRLDPEPPRIRVKGIGGSAKADVTTVKEFTIAGSTLKKVQFLVAGGGMGGGAVGLLGQNVLRIADVEYDLSNGAIRLMKPESGCSKTSMMSYWVKPGESYSTIDIAWATPEFPHTTGTAFIDGTKIRVLFDTGAATSLLSLRAAARAGVKTDDANVVKAGFFLGVGSSPEQTWIAPFDSFKIGGEEVKHTRLRIGELGNPEADMLIGADFFLSHRVYVASSQHKLYFTYNGGPVFNLTSMPSGNPPPPPPAAPVSADSVEPPPVPADEPKDAAAFSRRGVAFAARRDFQHALADLNRACELAPNEADFFFERGRAHLGNREPELALSDFDQAVKLKPDHVPALMSRVGLRLGMREGKEDAASGGPHVGADLDTIAQTVAKDSDARLDLGNFYARVGQFPQAIAQYDLWFGKHTHDPRLADALAFRCRARAMSNQELDKALADCNRAVRERANAPFFLDSRGIVYLRMGNFDKSIADYGAVLKLQPRNPWALYVRGVAKVRKGAREDGENDIAASRAIAPRAAADAERRGITP